jgi:L-lysine 2,3-aminomutase
MNSQSSVVQTRFRAYGPRHIDEIAERYGLSDEVAATVRRFSLVLPFRVNAYVLSDLIDWKRVPDDPIFQLVFPQPGMLAAADERRLAGASRLGPSSPKLRRLVSDIRARLNPHPADQMEANVPRAGAEPIAGLQHKYSETVLYFPSNGQTCHAYCTYCFRWAQFVGEDDLRFSAAGPDQLVAYLGRHPEVTDVLVTGGDPMVMTAARLREHLEPLLGVSSLRTIRIGTKSVAYWPQRFVTDADADETLRLFEDLVGSGRSLAVMAHFSHPREIGTDVARAALRRVRGTGAVVYCQAPLMAHVNDDPAVWTDLWRAELAAGAVPYYMFVARDTGPREYFQVPLHRAVDIFHEAYQTLPGLARTVRGPVMSTSPGKVVVDGVLREGGRSLFQLRFLRARDPAVVGRPFHASWSGSATWFDDLTLEATVPSDIAALARRRPQLETTSA